ncbi:hypothetical protein DYB35_000127 [Aphanomyces astaci]|uniref:Protein kinase domain-containing protein n=2 Tax=Aphanomyces astaci TaxID=112090 RepID=A0A3R7BL80_APHAT|nr:hypothetical protein DYB35_000127 [Aphanomyces astaci]
MSTTWLESSDYVGRFKALEAANVSVIAPSIPPPIHVHQRLEALDLRWSQLTPHAKHALLWDSGAVSASEDSYVQVYVSCGMSMSDIAISKDSLGTVLPTTDCLGPHGVTYVRQVGAVASFGALDRLTRCTISDAPLPNSNATTSVVYSQDALLPSDIPSLRVVLHRDETGTARPAIHSFIDAATSTTLSCPLVSQSVGLVILCGSRSANTTSTCVPTASPAMASWLSSIRTSFATTATLLSSSQDAGRVDSAPVIGSIAGGCVVIVLVTLGWCLYRRWKQRQALNGFTSALRPFTRPPPVPAHSISNVQNGAAVQRYEQPPPTPSTVPPSGPYYPQHHDRPSTDHPRPSHLSSLARNPFQSPSNSNLLDQLNPSAALAKLDQVPSHLRLPFDSITTTQLVDTGIRCKVYFGRYNHKLVVAVKTITLDHVHDHEIVDAFAEEIRLMASFHHPNVVALLGFAWDSVSLGSLMAVTEYLSQGNLSRFLTDNPALHWDLKASLALDVARALQYLHGLLQPKVIHRDIKPKNILLDWPSAKLSGFGVSREAMDDETLTAGVGSALYMAPEALRSGYYSVSADMYSFGCVLCELDTQRPLYADIDVPAKRIMHLILEEGLVPAVTPACPPAIRALAHQCFHQDASMRPTAFDVARDLDLFVHGDVGGGLV